MDVPFAFALLPVRPARLSRQDPRQNRLHLADALFGLERGQTGPQLGLEAGEERLLVLEVVLEPLVLALLQDQQEHSEIDEQSAFDQQVPAQRLLEAAAHGTGHSLPHQVELGACRTLDFVQAQTSQLQEARLVAPVVRVLAQDRLDARIRLARGLPLLDFERVSLE